MDASEENERDETPKPLAELLKAGAPTALENFTAALLASAGAGPMIAVAGGTFVGLAYAYDQMTYRARMAQCGAVLEQSSSAVGGYEALTALALDGPSRTELTARILDAAARTPLPEKIPALARVLTNAVDGTTPVDEALILADALRVIESPHLQTLALLEQRAASAVVTGDSMVDMKRRTFGAHEIADHIGCDAGLQLAILHVLDGQALVTKDLVDDAGDSYEFDVRRWMLTGHGQRCLGYLREQPLTP